MKSSKEMINTKRPVDINEGLNQGEGHLKKSLNWGGSKHKGGFGELRVRAREYLA
jgi:hypothetical protein